MSLHDHKGHRLYLTAAERAAFLVAAQHFPREVRTLCVLLHDTGCRISEALSLTADRVDFSGKAVIFETLKKRSRGVFRAVPVPAGTHIVSFHYRPRIFYIAAAISAISTAIVLALGIIYLLRPRRSPSLTTNH